MRNTSSVVHISAMGMVDRHRSQVGPRLIVLAGECQIVGKEVGWRIMGGVGGWGMVPSSGCEFGREGNDESFALYTYMSS